MISLPGEMNDSSLSIRKKRKYTKRDIVTSSSSSSTSSLHNINENKNTNKSSNRNSDSMNEEIKNKSIGKGKGKRVITEERGYSKKYNFNTNTFSTSLYSVNPKVENLIRESKKILSERSIEELDLSEKIDLLPNSLINLLKNGKFAIVKYHGSTKCIGIQKCDTMLGKKELKKIKELQFNSNELETSKALRIKFENDSKKSQHRFLIITPIVWSHWDWFDLQNAEIDYTKQK
jgi:hypothetical protein